MDGLVVSVNRHSHTTFFIIKLSLLKYIEWKKHSLNAMFGSLEGEGSRGEESSGEESRGEWLSFTLFGYF